MDVRQDAVAALPGQWRHDQEYYPDHLGGRIAAAVARLCAAELDNVLDGKPRASGGIAEEMVHGRTPADAVKTLSALLAMEPGETHEKVRERATTVLSHVDPSQSHARHVAALAEARLLREPDSGLPEPDSLDCGWSTWLIGDGHRVLLDPNGGVTVTGAGPVDPGRCARALLAAEKAAAS